MNIIRFSVGNILEMKKNHPCGTKRLEVKRVGSDIRVVCLGCGRDMVVPRIKLEKGIKAVLPSPNPDSAQKSEGEKGQ